MILKGIISAVSGQKAEVILPEFGNEVTAPLPILHDSDGAYTVGQWVVVAIFSDDFNDGVIL